MKAMDLLIKGGTVVTAEKSSKLDIRIKGESIVELGENLLSLGEKVIDVDGKLIFPGFIDTHTHFDLDAGDFHTADDFESGSKAAIVGGTTMVLDFATQNKGETLKEALQNWHKLAEGRSSCNYGFHMSISDWNENTRKELKDMTAAGVTSYKIYMAYDNLKVNAGVMYEILKAVKAEGGIIGVHCENGDLVNTLVREQKALGNLSPKAHPLSRPDEVEAEAIHELLTVARLAEAPVNIVHLSSKKGYEIVAAARAKGQKVFVETCPQYLLMEDSKYDLPGFESAKYVLSPPLRKVEDMECLWKAWSENEIDTIGTDHCSFHYKGQKERGLHDFSKIPNGIPGVEHRPALMYTYGVSQNRITKEQFCAALSTKPAKQYGMYPKKGVISVGSDADLVIWDPEYRGVIAASEQLQKVDYTPYEGMVVEGRAEAVLLQGKIVADQGKVILEKEGRYVFRGTCQDPR
jgi:dihydropyrimidinase